MTANLGDCDNHVSIIQCQWMLQSIKGRGKHLRSVCTREDVCTQHTKVLVLKMPHESGRCLENKNSKSSEVE